MKKLLAIMMASVLCLFLFTACGGNSEEASGEAAFRYVKKVIELIEKDDYELV